MQLLAKSEWYDWKLQWVEQLYETADDGFQGLEAVRSLFCLRYKALTLLRYIGPQGPPNNHRNCGG